MTLKEQIIWTVLGIEDQETLKKILALADEFLQEESDTPKSLDDPTSFLPSFSNINVATVDQVLSPDYRYPAFTKESIVGKWPGDEPVEQLIQMIKDLRIPTAFRVCDR